MDAEAASPPASIAGIDWEQVAAGIGPLTLELVAVGFPGWRTGQEGEFLFAVRSDAQDYAPHSPHQAVITAKTPIGLAEQLTVQEHLRMLPVADFARLYEAVTA